MHSRGWTRALTVAQPHSSQMPVAGSVIEHVGQIAGGASRDRVARATGVRAARGARVARTGAGRTATAGSVTSKPRLRRIATAPSVLLPNSSEVASRPVANRCATPATARRS